jgi:hypothetical protein
VGEFIPFGVILPTISPALFGSVAAGTLVTATSSTLASSVNFWLGRNFLSGRTAPGLGVGGPGGRGGVRGRGGQKRGSVGVEEEWEGRRCCQQKILGH